MIPLSAAAARAPNGAGVYFFLGASAELLYVGKAGDLRKRLQQHEHAKPGAGGARLAALYRRTREVRWEELPDADAAAVREADLIVALRPPFNASHSLEGRWAYVVVRPVPDSHRTRFSLCKTPETMARTYGCFPHLGRGVSSRPAIACSDGYTAFLRLLWAASGGAGHVPGRIGGPSPPDVFETTVDRASRAPLHAFLSGVSSALLNELARAGSRRADYMQPALARDRQAAESFFAYGPRALRRLRLRHGHPPGPMPKTLIESLLVAEVRQAIGDFGIPDPPDATDGHLGRRARRWARGARRSTSSVP